MTAAGEDVLYREMRARRVAAIGEPRITYLDPRHLASELGSAGFGHAEDLEPEEAYHRDVRNQINRTNTLVALYLLS